MVKDYLGNFYFIFITISITLNSCDSKDSNTTNYLQPKVAGDNLIINGDFEEWNEQHLLNGWSTRLLLPIPKMITEEDNKVSLHGSYIGKNYISQEVAVQPGNYYIAKIKYL